MEWKNGPPQPVHGNHDDKPTKQDQSLLKIIRINHGNTIRAPTDTCIGGEYLPSCKDGLTRRIAISSDRHEIISLTEARKSAPLSDASETFAVDLQVGPGAWIASLPCVHANM